MKTLHKVSLIRPKTSKTATKASDRLLKHFSQADYGPPCYDSAAEWCDGAPLWSASVKTRGRRHDEWGNLTEHVGSVSAGGGGEVGEHVGDREEEAYPVR